MPELRGDRDQKKCADALGDPYRVVEADYLAVAIAEMRK